jgi:chromatin segregation and condensation protein Rec8/ScpA/Scc1 (kleisin family)
MKRLLSMALKNRFEMVKEDAVALAKTVENIFGGQDEIEDMSIDKYSRALLYELQRQNLLKQRREEFKEQGKIIRKFYWSFNDEMIKQAAREEKQEDPYKIYKRIPKEAWATHSYCN